ncbi:MAG: general secretion pathway protein GspK, partial [Nitrospiraceae bacterium]
MKQNSSEEGTPAVGGNTRRGEEGGVALVLVIWVLVVLVAVVGEFSYSMRTEVNIARNFKEEEEAYQLALAGVEQAKLEIFSAKDFSLVHRKTFEDGGDMLVFGEEEEMPLRKGTLGRGSFEYTIDDEESRLNINTASLDQLKDLFLDSGIDAEAVDIIVDSIMDWRDTNDLHMLNGAEEDYYRSLDRPYSCKDGPFDTLEELLLVRGMTRDILFGSRQDEMNGEEDEEMDDFPGVHQYLTVYAPGAININTAGAEVLTVVLGADIADDLMAQRESGPLRTPMQNGKVSS